MASAKVLSEETDARAAGAGPGGRQGDEDVK
jgi:hypothetical protein